LEDKRQEKQFLFEKKKITTSLAALKKNADVLAGSVLLLKRR
jgi:hypothetical protein